MKYSYNWLKSYIPDAPSPDKLGEILTYHLFEVEGMETLANEDSVFDIKILPNRAHDLLSHIGLAREVASLLDIKFVEPSEKFPVPKFGPTELKVDIQSTKCRRYSARIVRNVKVGSSPEWIKTHLGSIGQRSINNIVDAANIVMFDCGQPIHCFDMDKMSNTIVIRDAKESDEIKTLDNKQIKLNPLNLVIADKDNVLAIAGVKGGKVAEVDENTKNIIIEVANFDAVAVRKSAKSAGIFTDASKRYENDLSPELVDYAMTEISALISEYGDVQFEEIVNEYPLRQAPQSLAFSAEKVNKVLGTKISLDEIRSILKRYNLEFKENDEHFEVTVPFIRMDLNIEEDMAEEIGRVVGYDKVKPNIPKIDFKPTVNETHQKIQLARNKLLSQSYSEVMTYAFTNKGEVGVHESASDKKFLRTNLTNGLKESLKLNQVNLPMLGMKEVKIFEIGTIFTKDGEEIHVAYGDKKQVKEMTLEEYVKNADPEVFSSASPDTFAQARTQPDHSQKHAVSAFSMWSLFPFIARDVAVWVFESVSSNEVMNVIKEHAGELIVRGPELFDEFKKDGKVSYAFRMVFQSYDRTLTDAEVNTVMEKISEKIKEKGWEVR